YIILWGANHRVYKRYACNPVAMQYIRWIHSLHIVLAANKIPQKVTYIHVVNLVMQKVVQVIAHGRPVNHLHLATAIIKWNFFKVSAAPALVSASFFTFPHTGEYAAELWIIDWCFLYVGYHVLLLLRIFYIYRCTLLCVNHRGGIVLAI